MSAFDETAPHTGPAAAAIPGFPWAGSIVVMASAALLRGYVDFRMAARLPNPLLPAEWVPLFALFSAVGGALGFLALWLVLVALAHLGAAWAAGHQLDFGQLVRVSGYGLIPIAATSLLSAFWLEPAILEIEAVYPGDSLDQLASALAASLAFARLRLLNAVAAALGLAWLALAVHRVHRLSPARSTLVVGVPLALLVTLTRLL